MNLNLNEYFGLNIDQAKALFSLQYHLVLRDIYIEKNIDIKQKKEEWLSLWQESIENTQEDIKILTSFQELISYIIKLRNEPNSTIPLSLILFEVVVFEPYYPLGFKEKDSSFLSLSFCDRKYIFQVKKEYAPILGLLEGLVKQFEDSYKKVSGELKKEAFVGSSFGAKKVIGLLTIPAALFFGVPLLIGAGSAAAITSFLAFLGGGAIATGGGGMITGIAVLVGGSSVLGSLGSDTFNKVQSLLIEHPYFALREISKFVVTYENIILPYIDDLEKAKPLLKEQRNNILFIENNFLDFRESKTGIIEKEEVKQIEESIQKSTLTIKYLKKGLKLAEDLYLAEFSRRASFSSGNS